MSSELLAIGEVARRSGKAASAIRFYEKSGLIAEPVRVSGRRRYPAEVVRSLAVIETAQRAGLTLDEIRLLLRANAEDAAAIELLREVAERRLPLLAEAIERAELVRRWLEQAASCRCPSLEECPLFDEPSPLPERRLSLA
jgi:MerR family transcriptional regulator, redox-sensitive transcriptional activator SoxR